MSEQHHKRQHEIEHITMIYLKGLERPLFGLVAVLAVLGAIYAAMEPPNRISKALYFDQIREWSNLEPTAINSAIQQLLQTGKTMDINGLHFEAAATQISQGTWVADCAEDNTGVTFRTAGHSSAQTAMDACIEELRSTIVVSVSETVAKGTHSISTAAGRLWQAAADVLRRAQIRAEDSQQEVHDRYKELADKAAHR